MFIMRYTTLFLLAGLLVFAACSNDAADTSGTSDEAAVPVAVHPGVYAIDRSHSEVGFVVRHLGLSNVRGTFEDYNITVEFEGEDISTISANATIPAESINTRNGRRDAHLRSDDFFDVEVFPEITFVTTGVENVNGETLDIHGDLTIRDVTQPVVFNATVQGVTSTSEGVHRVGLYGEAAIDRHEFGLTWDNLTETGGAVVGPRVRIVLDLQLIQRPPREES